MESRPLQSCVCDINRYVMELFIVISLSWQQVGVVKVVSAQRMGVKFPVLAPSRSENTGVHSLKKTSTKKPTVVKEKWIIF